MFSPTDGRKAQGVPCRLLFTILAFGLLFSQAAAAQGGLIPIGSPLTFGGTNSPDTYSAATTFGPTHVLVDNGRVEIWQEQVPTGTNGEWDLFYMKTTDGGPLAGNINAYWDIVIAYQLSQPVNFDEVVNQWLVNGTPVSPLTNGIGGPNGICCATTSNPILPGPAYYNSGFVGPLSAGTQSNWRQIFVTPYNIVSIGGINPSTANEFIFGLHFTLQQQPMTTTLATDFSVVPFASEAIVTAFGTNLSVDTQGATTVPLPTILAGTSIMVTDSLGVPRQAPLFYVSPGQVNYQIPPGTANGTATVTLTSQASGTQTETIQVANLSPGLFELNSSGLVAAWVLPIDSGVQQALEPVYQLSGTNIVARPIDVSSPNRQMYLELYGTGIRHAGAVTVTIGGLDVPILYFGPAPGAVGEDQINIGPLPSSLAGRGSVDIILTADGLPASTANMTIP